MTDQLIDNPPKPKAQYPPISRKNFLKFSMYFAGAYVAARTGYFLAESFGMDHSNFSPEVKKMLDDIIIFRKSLGLEGLPTYIQTGLNRKTKWASERIDYVDSLPEKNRSYSLRIFEVISKIFGHNATQIIRGSKPDPEYPYGMSFDPKSRFCNVSDSVHEIPLPREFTDYILHEACGHGSDPQIGADYPPEIFIRVEHGKWRALSQAFTIPDQFFNHPGDLTLPLLERYVGETVGRYITDGQKIDIVDVQSIPKVIEIITKIANKRGRDINQLKFNKAVCREIGEELIYLLRNGILKFEGDLKKTYQSRLEEALIEIYAEMFKYALLYPDLIQNNENILGGIIEVISAIRGSSNTEELSLPQLRQDIINPSKEIMTRYEAEKAMLTPTSSLPTIATLTPEEQERLKNQEEEFAMLEKAFQDFVNEGKIPTTLIIQDEQKKLVEEFATLYGRVIKKYPMLKDTYAQQYNETFDPEMHIWEIREVENAMDSGFIRSLVSSQRISDEMINEILSKVRVIRSFVNNPAF